MGHLDHLAYTNNFEAFCEGKCTFGEIDVDLCNKFKEYLYTAPQTIHKKQKLHTNTIAGYCQPSVPCSTQFTLTTFEYPHQTGKRRKPKEQEKDRLDGRPKCNNVEKQRARTRGW